MNTREEDWFPCKGRHGSYPEHALEALLGRRPLAGSGGGGGEGGGEGGQVPLSQKRGPGHRRNNKALSMPVSIRLWQSLRMTGEVRGNDNLEVTHSNMEINWQTSWRIKVTILKRSPI